MELAMLKTVRAAALACTLVPISAFTSSSITNGSVSKIQPSIGVAANTLRMSSETNILVDFGAGYSTLLENQLYPTQSATGGVFSLLGDAIAQVVEGKSGGDRQQQSYDSQRGLIYFLKGLGGGVMWTYWFGVVDPLASEMTSVVLLGQNPSPTMEQATRTGVSILLEQFLVCPTFFTLWDIPLPALLRGSSPRQIPAQIQEKLSPLLVANAKVWTYVFPLAICFLNLSS